jgi:hypothetical protein
MARGRGQDSIRPSRRRARKSADALPRVLLDLGLDPDLPPLPGKLADLLIAPELTGARRLAAQYINTEGAAALAKNPTALAGVGVGWDEATDRFAIVYLLDNARPRGTRLKLPESTTFQGTVFPIKTVEIDRVISLPAGTWIPGNQFTPQAVTGALTGSLIGTNPLDLLNGAGGTLSGTFRSTSGHDQRGLTNAHVALDLGIQNLIQQFPGSLKGLFGSPSGKRLISWPSTDLSGDGPGQPYELFRVDTPWPILTPIPFIPGLPATLALGFLYTDVASGPIRPLPIPGWSSFPPPPPQEKLTVQGDLLGTGRMPHMGSHPEEVYKIGTALGTHWGRVFLSPFVLPLPIPSIIAGLPTIFLIFDLDLYELPIAPGDSGSVPTAAPPPAQVALTLAAAAAATGLFGTPPPAFTTASKHDPFGVAGLGLGSVSYTQQNKLTLATPAHLVRAFADVRF